MKNLLYAVNIKNMNISKSILAPENNKKVEGFKTTKTGIIKLKKLLILNILSMKNIEKKINKYGNISI
tara:strand:- start:37 stop:240 length:204 start_codon:yes stop_codon:yes gene_type:complete